MSGDVVEHWFNSTKTYLHLRHFKPLQFMILESFSIVISFETLLPTPTNI